MHIIKLFYQYLIDFVFPPSKEELEIRSVGIDWLIENGVTASKPEFHFIHALFSYKNPLIKELVWQIKYKKNKHALRCASFALFNYLSKYNDCCTLIPIPISKKRRIDRGFNQSELLIDEIIKFDIDKKFNKNYDLLKRSRHIDYQTLKDRNERIENTKDIFIINEKIKIHGKIFILDDVTTTGSTLFEARNALIKNGYLDIEAITLAH